jgi:hypothetical protein
LASTSYMSVDCRMARLTVKDVLSLGLLSSFYIGR